MVVAVAAAVGEAVVGTGGAEAVVAGTLALIKEAKASIQLNFLTTQMTKVKKKMASIFIQFNICFMFFIYIERIKDFLIGFTNEVEPFKYIRMMVHLKNKKQTLYLLFTCVYVCMCVLATGGKQRDQSVQTFS